MTTRFDRDTEVHQLERSAGVTRYQGRIDSGWWVVRGPNGGYVAALVLRALANSAGADRAPRSLTVHYTAPPEACASFASMIPMHDRYDYRFAIGALPGAGMDRALVGGWIRSAEHRVADAALVAAFTDAWPPACFAWARERDGLGPVPTVDLTIHFRRDLPLANAAPDDFYLAVFRSRFAEQGFVEEDGEVWSRDGMLLAQSRQLAVIG